MPYSLEAIGDEVIAFLDTTVFPGQKVVEHAIPDVAQIEVDSNGRFESYVNVQLGDLQEWGANTLTGPQDWDYVLPIYFQVVSGSASTARKLGNRAIQRFLGKSFEWAGQVRKRLGGSVYPLETSNGAVEAYVFPLSFALTIQLGGDVGP